MFCGPETVDVSRSEAKPRETSTVEGPQNTAFPRFQSISILLYQNSKKRKNNANFLRKYMKNLFSF